MKKALVLGVMAFFAINVISIQNATAQEDLGKATNPDKTTVSVQKNTEKDLRKAETAKTDDKASNKSKFQTSISDGTKVAKGNAQTGMEIEHKAIKMEEKKDLKTSISDAKPEAASSKEVGKINLSTVTKGKTTGKVTGKVDHKIVTEGEATKVAADANHKILQNADHKVVKEETTTGVTVVKEDVKKEELSDEALKEKAEEEAKLNAEKLGANAKDTKVVKATKNAAPFTTANSQQGELKTDVSKIDGKIKSDDKKAEIKTQDIK